MVDTLHSEATEPETQDEVVRDKLTPGQILREARFAEDQSEAQIASRLYLSRNVVRFIENDEYDKLPGTTFIRGYLRSYARLVNVSSEKVMEAFDALGITSEHAPPVIAPITRAKKEVSANDKSIRWVTYIIIITLLGLVAVWWRSHSDNIEDVVAEPAATVAVAESNKLGEITNPASLELRNGLSVGETLQSLVSSHPNTESEVMQRTEAISPDRSVVSQSQ